jgi:hypothetical protein
VVVVVVSSAVRIQPGEIAFTRIRWRPSFLARAFTSIDTPAAFAAAALSPG